MLPDSEIKSAMGHPLLSRLLITDAGYFPFAQHHGRQRPESCNQTILIYCHDGEGQYTVGSVSGTLKANQALIIPRGMPHGYRSSNKAPWSIHWVHFMGADEAAYTHMFCPSRC